MTVEPSVILCVSSRSEMNVQRRPSIAIRPLVGGINVPSRRRCFFSPIASRLSRWRGSANNPDSFAGIRCCRRSSASQRVCGANVTRSKANTTVMQRIDLIRPVAMESGECAHQRKRGNKSMRSAGWRNSFKLKRLADVGFHAVPRTYFRVAGSADSFSRFQ